MQKVLTAAQMREVDRLTTERYGIPSIILMENAAHAVARVITEKLGGSVKGKSILILCGKGNNGGDGAALARILWTHGATVDVFLLGKVEDTKDDARVNFEIVKALSNREFQVTPLLRLFECGDLDREQLPDVCHHHVFVDALFGTGLKRPIDENTKGFLMALRGQEHRELSVSIDLPSGLDSDSGEVIGPVFQTDMTVSFTAPKMANVLPPASTFNGSLIVTNIGTPSENFDLSGYGDELTSELFLTQEDDIEDWLVSTRYSADSYKSKRGHALVIAGSEDYSGAPVLAGNAAMRSGVGLVTAVCPANAKAEIAPRLLPDVILKTFESFEANELTNDVDAVAVGCGLDANDPAIEKLVHAIIENRKVPVIVDAGALWFYNPPKGIPRDEDRPPLIFTPHEGEFLRLLGTDDKDAIKDRVAAVREFATKHNVILVLKGERVFIGAPDGKVVVNPTGNSGLGKAGNGDTLTGILAGFVAQAGKMNIDIFETVVAAVYIAGMAGDVAENKYGKRVMTASDVRECLTDVFAAFEENK